MKAGILVAVLSAGLIPPGSAEQPAPASFSPQVGGDGSVTFRVRAAGAGSVEVGGQFGKERVKLARGERDLWSATTAPIAPGVYEYSIFVDGRPSIDPGNPLFKPQREPQSSILHLPATPPAPWDWQDVPHGTVHQHGYLSKALGRPRELWVYTPPGYERGMGKKHPLLVLQHGSGDTHQTWVVHGKAHWIFDSLIAAGKARPAIVLMLDGHPLGMVGRDTSPERRFEAMKAFQAELFDDALPLVESLYRLEQGAAHRAIAGLSMGGNQALVTGLNNLDRFAWVAGMSSAIREPAQIEKFLADPGSANSQLRLLWVGCGREDFLVKENDKLDAMLTDRGIRHTYRASDGGHAWPVWRGYLAELAPLLFVE